MAKRLKADFGGREDFEEESDEDPPSGDDDVFIVEAPRTQSPFGELELLTLIITVQVSRLPLLPPPVRGAGRDPRVPRRHQRRHQGGERAQAHAVVRVEDRSQRSADQEGATRQA